MKYLGNYLLLGCLIFGCGIYYVNNDATDKMGKNELTTGAELNQQFKKEAVSIIGTLVRVNHRQGYSTATLNFISRDGYDFTVFVVANLDTLAEANLQLGQSYKVSGVPVSRGTLSIRSLRQLELANQESNSSICFVSVNQTSANTGYGVLCDNRNVTVNYRSTVPVKSRTTYAGYWTWKAFTREAVFNITGY